MFCYNCGCRLSDHDFCTSCGADVARYKKIMYIANMYYNDGLAKAKLRDLTGAVTSLRQSLKFNKNNVEARNLLGLVYFEMGEVTAALCEWIISKNLKSDKNVADDYISRLQSSVSRFEALGQTVKKYNQALNYCKQGSKDLAIIQLKKVLSMNSKFIRAHQLLALLYMDAEQWEKAKRELVKCINLDRNNTMTLTYMREVESILNPEEGAKPAKKKQEEVVRYQSDNEIIIQPMNVAEPKRSGAGTLLNIALGLLIGVAAMNFLVVPAVRTNAKNEAQAKIAEIGNQIDAKNTTITELENKIKDLESEAVNLNGELERYAGTDGTLKNIEELINAATMYLAGGDLLKAAEALEKIKENVVLEETSNSYQNLYNALYQAIGVQIKEICFDEGYTAYTEKNYEESALKLGWVVKFDENNADAQYYYGQSCRQLERNDEAIAAYKKVLELAPNTEKAANAERHLNRLEAN
ncbi:MAG: tetratricopeptide repeat protein [Lachnospiraceae bacterium]|nr:tetratricopeptide repeat protein [Lachnospiraceae bacterium]